MNLGYETKRVAGVEPKPSQVHDAPPAHDHDWRQPVLPGGSRLLGGGTETAGVMPRAVPPPVSPAEAFCEHFFRCFFCRVGDRIVNDYFCRDGRELMVAMLDDRFERRSYAE